ncbi:MAG: hypothetical protein ABFC84_01505 [Veillonellales bacterium]
MKKECFVAKIFDGFFPYSNRGFCQVFGGEIGECVCQGLKDIFEYIGGVARGVAFDNATGVKLFYGWEEYQ